jgi:sugar phosphate permease
MEKSRNINDFGKHGWLIIFYTLFLFWFSSAPVDLLNVSVDAFAGMKQWDGNNLLIFSSIGIWVSIIVTALAGRWVAFKGVRVPTTVCLSLMGWFMMLNGFASSIPLYGFAVVAMTGISGAINLVSTNTFMSNWFPKRKGIALGWSTMGMCVSSAVSIPVFAMLLNATHSLIVPYALFGAVVIILALVTQFGVKATPEEAGAYPDNEAQTGEQREAALKALREYRSPWTVGKLLRCPQVWLVSLCFGFLFIALMATMTQFVPRFMGAGFSQNEALMWLSVTGVLGIFGSYLWGYLDQKTTTKKAVVVYAVYMAVIQYLNAVFFANKTISIVLIVLIGILIGGIGNLFPSMVIQLFGRYDFAVANSVCVPMLTAIRAFTFIIIAVVLGMTHGSFRILCVVLGCVSTMAVILSLFLSNKTIGKEVEATN